MALNNKVEGCKPKDMIGIPWMLAFAPVSYTHLDVYKRQEKNNLHDMDTWMFFKWFFKAAVAIYLVTHTFDIVMAVFDIGQNVVSGAAGVIHGNTSIDIDATIAQMRTGMENMGVGELLGLSIETLLISLCLKIMAILITVILYGLSLIHI